MDCFRNGRLMVFHYHADDWQENQHRDPDGNDAHIAQESKGKVAGLEGAAAKLGIPPSTLDTKIKQLGIKKHRFIS
jgi:hypothetical protein